MSSRKFCILLGSVRADCITLPDMNRHFHPFLYSTSVAEAVSQTAVTLSADRVFVLVDDNTHCHCLPHLADMCKTLNVEVVTIPVGEKHKTLATMTEVWQQLVERGATRRSLLINLGGGVVCDVGGFAAATFKRGMPFINIPTTLLAMVDAAAGGKNGINFNGLKNEIGTFAQPSEVLVSLQWLATLSDDELLSGYGEMLKHALLADEHHWAEVMRTQPGDMVAENALPLLQRSQQVKVDIVAEDPHEQGLRKVLNLGHTTAHALETLHMMRDKDASLLPHGHAVAHGLVMALYLSCALRKFPTDKMRQTIAFIHEHYGRPDILCDDYDTLYDIMSHDKKNTGKQPAFVLLNNIGQAVYGQKVDKQLLFEAFDFLREG